MNVAVIGAGLAGLAAACDVAGAGGRVIVLERRPWAGGKTYSFAERETGEAIDNGQHIAMRCTTEYVDFLRQIGTAHLMRWQDRLCVPVFDANGRRSDLAASALPAPLHLGPSFARYAHLSVLDKMRIGRAIFAMRRMSNGERVRCDGVSFAAWLRAHGQSETAIRDFWDLIVVPALNCRSEDASASQAMFVFCEGFLKSAESAAVGIPTVGLSALHVEPAVRDVESRGGEVRTSAPVEEIEVGSGRVRGLRLASGERIEADAYVCALPPKQTLDVLPSAMRSDAAFRDLASMRMSPIVNVHLWFDGPIAEFEFAAFVGSDVQWVFRPRSVNPSGDEHVVISLSAADKFVGMTKADLVELLLPQLRRALPGAGARALLRSAVIKEPEATFVPSPGLRRPGTHTPVANLVLAGAHVDTGWPATMESAVRSGRMAARAVMGMRANIEQQQTSRDAVAV